MGTRKHVKLFRQDRTVELILNTPLYLNLSLFALALFFAFSPCAMADSVSAGAWNIHWGADRAVAYSRNSADSIVIFQCSKSRSTASKTGVTLDENSYEMASIVGSLISYRHTYNSQGASNQGNQGDEFVTIDLDKKGKMVRLSDFFDEAELLNSLKKDSFILKSLGSEATVLSGLFDQISSGCEMLMSSGGILYSFAFHHIKDSLVAVRIGIPHKCDITAGKFVQIGIYLPIPNGLQKQLLDAADNHTLMADLRGKIKNK